MKSKIRTCGQCEADISERNYRARWCVPCAKEKRLEKARERRETNPEYYRQQQRLWRAANPEKLAEYDRQWREANPDK